ncbi:MAG TPA: hypothetical protein VKB84_22370 [Candidatus Binataceae bacterium]|nr:hypothetical protein [Candidatus Binataceae bacterium]
MSELESSRGLAATLRRPAAGDPVRLPIYFFAIAIFSFALGTATAPWAAVKLAEYFYQLQVLSWVHTFTLGWITSALMGVMFGDVPAKAERELRFPRLAKVQLVLYFLGASGVVAHFMLGSWDGVWMAGAVVALSVILFAINIVPGMARSFGRAAAETGLLIALLFLLCASCFGALLAFDKGRGFMAGTLLRNLSAHAHLAALGWVTLAICATSYRFMAATGSKEGRVPRSALAQIFALAAATVALFVALIGGDGVPVSTVLVAAALVAYAIVFQGIAKGRAVPADWAIRHAMAAIFCLLLAAAAGIALAVAGAGSPFDARLVCTYGVLGILGWVSNFIVGMSYRLFTGLVARVRSVLGWPHLSMAELSIDGGRPLVFWALNAGVLLMAGGLLAGRVSIAQAGAFLIALGGLVYSAAMAHTLSFAYRRAAPAAPGQLLRAAQD